MAVIMPRVWCVVALLLVCVVVSASASTSKLVSDPELIEKVNADPSVAWTAGVNKRFAQSTVENVKPLLGYKKDMELRSAPGFESLSARNKPEKQPVGALPASFDARQKWPLCVGPIVDQGDCGSCWAFGAVESLQDRFCIDSNNKHFNFSEQEVVSCVDGGLEGCNGGDPMSAWAYMATFGVVDAPCIPYTSGKAGDTGFCPWSCTNSSATWTKHYGLLDSITYHDTVVTIQNAIFTYGPVEACFTVYADFMNYKSGVYSHTSGGELGGHCVKLVGWGNDNASNKAYWIVANSWGPVWGLNGYFWIERGVNECGIEDDVWEGLPSL